SLPDLERASMGPWLAGIGRRCLQWWRDGVYTPEMVGRVTKAVLLESLLGGTTTVADQYYFYPGGVVAPYLEATIEAAREVGVRIHAGRGSITLGESGGGTAADILVETIDGRIGEIRPRLPATAQLAVEHPQVRLHTHLYEKVDAAVCAQTYGTTPWRMLQSHGWAGERTWLAHVNDPPPGEVPEMAAAGVGVTHLIAPDLRLGWGLAPVRAYLDREMTVGFGTTGSASNDGANMLADMRLAALAHRPAAQDPAQWISARELIRMATAGSAACIGRDDLGSIAAGYAADIACWDMNTVDRVGVHDPVAGLVLTGLSQRANLVIVGGRVLVEGGVPMLADEAAVARSARDAIPM
ncbi:MAG: amidohydrolase family protein, partial [Acidimicrobiia bacterium]